MSSPRRLPDWLLERAVLDELPLPLSDATRRRLDGSPPSSEERQRILEENAKFLADHPPERLLRRAKAEKERTSASAWRWPALSAASFVALAATLVLVLRPPGGDPDIRLKGLVPGLSVYRESASGPERLRDGTAVHPGDVLQVRYHAAGQLYGVIVSVDGAQNVTLHLPEAPEMAPRLEPSGEVTLPHGYRLDAAPRFERFLFITSSQPIPTGEVIAATRSWAEQGFTGAGPALPAPARLSIITLPKAAP